MPLTKNQLLAVRINLRNAYSALREMRNATYKYDEQFAKRLQVILLLIEDELHYLEVEIKK